MSEQVRVLAELQSATSMDMLVRTTLELWPEHAKFLTRAFGSRTVEELNDSYVFADLILKIAGARLPTYIASYRWMCEEFTGEQLHFSRTGSYRFSRLDEVEGSVYGQSEYMTRYMDGLLISQVFWNNHLRAASLLKHRFLPANKLGGRHLEIGPGHGLFMYFAAESGRSAGISGWDISETSLTLTRHCIEKLGISMNIDLRLRDVSANSVTETFDSIVLSEVLEHVEDPLALLKGVAENLSSDGRIFINVPVNSPAPDHIFLLKSPEEAIEIVRASGLHIVEQHLLPETGMSIEQAAKRNATVSCVIIGQR